MPYNLAVSPDFKPDLISGWFIFNTWLQRQIDEVIHLEIHQDFKEQYEAINNQLVDLIYANPFDISRLVRDKDFVPLVRPILKPDEAIVACKAGAFENIHKLKTPLKIARTDTPEVNTIGMIMLEPADVNKDNVEYVHCDNFVIVAKHLIKDTADVGFFLAGSFNDLSPLIKNQLSDLVTSQIHMIYHAFLISPKLLPFKEKLTELLLDMKNNESGKKILAEIGIVGFEPMNDEDAEFMIDLMDTLTT